MGTVQMALPRERIHTMAPAGFTELYERYSATVYKTALRVTGNPSDAEDVLQTVYLRIFNQMQSETERATVLGELYAAERYFKRAATNASLDILRRRVTKNEAPLDASYMHAAPETSVYLKQRLRQALSTLPGKDAEMFLLRYVEGLSNGEIASLYGMMKARVAVKLFKIRQKLQAEMA